MERGLKVFLCGEPLRGDDGLALRAAALLPEPARRRARLEEVGQLDLLDLTALGPDEPCLIVDAVAGIAPGELYAAPLEALREDVRARSSHRLPLSQTLALAGLLRDAPVRGRFLGLGAERFDLGAEPSPRVCRALPALAAAIGAEIDRHAALETDRC
jgi:hydrogenase maturation protease